MFVQRPAHTLRPMTTAHLAQTMTLLSLTAVELRQKIEAALASNPALELLEERRCPTCKRRLPGDSACPFCSRPQSSSPDQPIVFISPREDFHTFRDGPSEEMPDEGFGQAAGVEDLPEYVLRQIAPELEPEERPIAAHILTSLDEDGLLSVPVMEIARYHHVPISQVESVIHLIQRAEPIGVASPSPREALLVQLEVLAETRPIPPLASKAIQEGMELLSRHRYSELAHLLGITTPHAHEIARFISENLNPFPGRAHWGDINYNLSASDAGKNTFRYPDIIFSLLNPNEENSTMVVEIAMPLAGTLRVNPLFREAIRQAPVDKTDKWKEDLEQATLLVKCLQQRNHTIVRLMQLLTVLQREFILHGDAYLQPITRASLSKELDVHESTISRAVSAKAVQLPNGHIVPLAMFFDRSLHIRTALKQIVEQENEPLSDNEIGDMLAQLGFPVARRTVAKYRAMEGILPAHLRKPFIPQSRPAVLTR
ncbi:MAG: hypothetical protein ACM3PY_14790 [Omnitrophica WOR_2 bacterium]